MHLAARLANAALRIDASVAGFTLKRNLLYLLAEIPRRTFRRMLCGVFGVSTWHVAAMENKPYVPKIIDYVNARAPQSVVEIGCGFCDIIGGLNARMRVAYDADPSVVKAARVYTTITGAHVDISVLDLAESTLPSHRADVWILVNFLHSLPPDIVEPT